MGEREGGMIWENGIETCIISYMKQVASPGSIHDTGCRKQGTNASALGQTRGRGWGGRWERGSGWGDTCVPVTDSC